MDVGQPFFTEADSLAAMADAAYQGHGLTPTTPEQGNVCTAQHGNGSVARRSREGTQQIASLTLAVDPTALSREGMR